MMKYIFYIFTVVLTLMAVRVTDNTDESIVPAIILVGLAILCFYCAMIYDSILGNNKTF